MSDLTYLWLLLMAAVSIALAWLAVRAFRARRRVVKWVGGVVASLIAALVCSLCIVVGNGMLTAHIRHAPVPIGSLTAADLPDA
jgi:uncharacterized SAM-binding protein YcdF (DUF218 family)